MPYSNFYFKNWFTQLLFRMTHMRLYMYLDLVLLVINLVLLCLPQVMEGTIPGLVLMSRIITYIFIVWNMAKLIAIGWRVLLGRRTSLYQCTVAVLCVIEIFYLHLPYSKLYTLRGFELLRLLASIKLPKQLKIFAKTFISFTAYILPYFFILLCLLFMITLISMNLFRKEIYVSPYLLEKPDLHEYLAYFVTSMQVLLVSDWQKVLNRCSYAYGSHTGLYFIFCTIILKYFLENLMLAFFVYIYSDVHSKYAKEDASRIFLTFEKTNVEKKKLLGHSIFKNHILNLGNESSAAAPQQREKAIQEPISNKNSPISPNKSSVRPIPKPNNNSKITGVRYVSKALKFFKGARKKSSNLSSTLRLRTGSISIAARASKQGNIFSKGKRMTILSKDDTNLLFSPRLGENTLGLEGPGLPLEFNAEDSPQIPERSIARRRSRIAPGGNEDENKGEPTPVVRFGHYNPPLPPLKLPNPDDQPKRYSTMQPHSDLPSVEESPAIGFKLIKPNLPPIDLPIIAEDSQPAQATLETEANEPLMTNAENKDDSKGEGSPTPQSPDRGNRPFFNLFRFNTQGANKTNQVAPSGFRRNASQKQIHHRIDARLPSIHNRLAGVGSGSFLLSMSTMRHSSWTQIFTRKGYWRLSFLFSIADVAIKIFVTETFICTDRTNLLTLVAVVEWIINLFFFLELVFGIGINRYNSRQAIKQRIVPRISLDYFEVVLLVAGIIHTSLLRSFCTESALSSAAYLVSIFNFYRVIRRSLTYKRYSWIIIRSINHVFLGLVVFFSILMIFAISSYSMFKGYTTSCDLPTFENITKEKVCIAEGGHWTSFMVNYDSFISSYIVGYAMIDRALWSTVFELVIISWNNWSGYLVWKFISVMLLVVLLNIVLRAYTISVCYINIGSFSIVNADPNISLGPERMEWIQIEEQICKVKLLKKKQKLIHPWSIFCRKVKNSRLWHLTYYISILVGFIINLCTYTGEPDFFKTVKLTANIIVISIINIDVYISFQAENFVNVWYEDSLRSKFILALCCNIVILITYSLDIFVDIGFQVIYIHAFVIIKDWFKGQHQKSHLAYVYQVFVSQISNYIQTLSFILLLSMTAALILAYIIPNNDHSKMLNSGQALAYLLTWVYDNNWFIGMLEFSRKLSSRQAALRVIMVILVYAIQFFYKNVIHKLFISVVVDGFNKSQALSDFVFNQDVIDELLKAWLKYDPDGKGYIRVADYFRFLVGINPPLRLTVDELLEKIGMSSEKFDDLPTRRCFIRNEQDDVNLTIKQFYIFLNIYNLPVYLWDNKEVVHFRDVISLISKVAVENKYNPHIDIKYESKILERSLFDLWLLKYPELSQMKEKYSNQLLSQGKKNSGYDTKKYQAVTTLQKIYFRYKSFKKVKLMKMSQIHSYMLNLGVAGEEATNERLKVVGWVNKTMQQRKMFDSILYDQKHLRARSFQKSNSKKRSNNPPPQDSSPTSRSFYENRAPDSEFHKLSIPDFCNIYPRIFKAKPGHRLHGRFAVQSAGFNDYAGAQSSFGRSQERRKTKRMTGTSNGEQMVEPDIVRSIDNFDQLGLQQLKGANEDDNSEYYDDLSPSMDEA